MVSGICLQGRMNEKMKNTNKKEEIYIAIDELFKKIDREFEFSLELPNWVMLRRGSSISIKDKIDKLKYYIEKLKESE